MSAINSFDEEFLEIFGSKTFYENVKETTKKIMTQEIEEAELSVDDQITPDSTKAHTPTKAHTKDVCLHSETVDNDGVNVCKSCGLQFDMLDFQPEWRYYGATDNKTAKDPSRCHKPKQILKGGISKVFEDAKLTHLSDSIRKKTEQRYRKIVGETTVRGKGRKAIVAACLLYTFRDEGTIRTSDEVRSLFGLSKQDMSAGISRYCTTFRDTGPCVTPAALIKRIMDITQINHSHHKRISRIAVCLQGVDEILNRSSPQAVASAIVYLYLCLTPALKEQLKLSKKSFASGVNLSEITISKLVKRIAEILNNPNIEL